MKLCNHRDPRNGPGSCCLRACDVSGAKWDYQSSQVFVKEGLLPDARRWFTYAFQCTEKMSEICPYRVHTVIEKPPPKPKPEKCKRCGARHYPDRGVSQLFCDAKDEFDKLMQSWTSEGSKQSIWPADSSYERYRVMLWPWIVGEIMERDKWKCQDCGSETDSIKGEKAIYHQTHRTFPKDEFTNERIQFEVHHILPKGLGGSDHPANLKLVCQNCHKKYNEQFNGEIISKKAQERKVKKIRETIQSLESFEVGPSTTTLTDGL